MRQELAEGKVRLKTGATMTRRELIETKDWLQGLLLDDAEAFLQLYEKSKDCGHQIPDAQRQVLRRYRFLTDDGFIVQTVTDVLVSCLWELKPGAPFVLGDPYAR